MLTLYFVLFLLAFVCFAAAALTRTDAFGRSGQRFSVSLVPLGLALVSLVWMLQALNRL